MSLLTSINEHFLDARVVYLFKQFQYTHWDIICTHQVSSCVLDSVISTRHGEGAAKDLKTIVCSVFLKAQIQELPVAALDCVNLSRDATQDPSLKAWAWAEETQISSAGLGEEMDPARDFPWFPQPQKKNLRGPGDFPDGPAIKNAPCNAENMGLIPDQQRRSHVPQGD